MQNSNLHFLFCRSNLQWHHWSNCYFIIPWWWDCLDQSGFQHNLQQDFSPSLQLPAIAPKEPFKYGDSLKCCTLPLFSFTLCARYKSMDQKPVISLSQTEKYLFLQTSWFWNEIHYFLFLAEISSIPVSLTSIEYYNVVPLKEPKLLTSALSTSLFTYQRLGITVSGNPHWLLSHNQYLCTH